jgi:DNA-directed RNA polymerase sigma subunit (sigma70/sigma32)
MRANRTLRHFAAHIRKLPHLSIKEKDVLIRRLKTTTLERIGLKYDVTEARIRQIEKKALKKVRSRSYQQKLFDR